MQSLDTDTYDRVYRLPFDAHGPQSVSAPPAAIRTLVVERDQECHLESQLDCCGVDVWNGPHRHRIPFIPCVVRVIPLFSSQVDYHYSYGNGRLPIVFYGLHDWYLYVKFRSKWSTVTGTCISLNPPHFRVIQATVTVSICRDFTQLIIMLVGLLRLRRNRKGIVRYLYIQVGMDSMISYGMNMLKLPDQGLIWLFTVTVIEFPGAVRSILPL